MTEKSKYIVSLHHRLTKCERMLRNPNIILFNNGPLLAKRHICFEDPANSFSGLIDIIGRDKLNSIIQRMGDVVELELRREVDLIKKELQKHNIE